MTIENGRPADESGRLEKETAVYDLLEQLDIPFTRADHEPAFTMDLSLIHISEPTRPY